jgi:c-di-GMP-related signal transduction protein
MDALLETPLETVLASVDLPQEVAEALLGTTGRLRALFDLVCAYLQGNSEPARRNGLGVSEQTLTSCYLEAVRSVDLLTALAGN